MVRSHWVTVSTRRHPRQIDGKRHSNSCQSIPRNTNSELCRRDFIRAHQETSQRHGGKSPRPAPIFSQSELTPMAHQTPCQAPNGLWRVRAAPPYSGLIPMPAAPGWDCLVNATKRIRRQAPTLLRNRFNSPIFAPERRISDSRSGRRMLSRVLRAVDHSARSNTRIATADR